MRIEVYVLPGGRVQIMVDGVAFDEAKAATLGLLALFQANGISVQQASEVESHRDSVTHVHELHATHDH